MRDGVDEAEVQRARLVYPFAAGPETGGAVEVAPGVKWMRMPLGGSLAFINVWAVREAEGWAVVDTGMRGPAATSAWLRVFAEVFDGEPVTRVLATHMHPDHVGMAGWITRKFDCRLWMTRLEYLTCRVLAADTGREAPEDGMRFFQAAGWGEAGPSTCATVNGSASSCQLTLTYTETAPTGSATLPLGFSYTNNAGQSRSGTLNIQYSAN